MSEDVEVPKPVKNVAKIETHLVYLLRRRPIGDIYLDPLIARFPYDLRVVRKPADKEPIILEVQNNTAKLVSVEHVAGLLGEFLSLYASHTNYLKQDAFLKKVVLAWWSRTSDMPFLPKSVGFKSDPELVLNRLPYDPDKTVTKENWQERIPTFANMMRFVETNGESLKARWGSIHDWSADRKQSVVMYGPRDCGKSQLLWLTMQIAGGPPLTRPLDNTAIGEDKKYLKESLEGKRVALVAEAAVGFLSDSLHKDLIGDDFHRYRGIYSKPRDGVLKPLFFFFTNKEPTIPHDDSVLNKIIPVRMMSVPESEMIPEHELRARLLSEIEGITGYCMNVYKEMKERNGNRLECDSSALVEAVDEYESEYLDFIDEHLVMLADKESAGITRSQLQRLMQDNGMFDTKKQMIVKRILKMRYGLKLRKLEYPSEGDDKNTQGGTGSRRIFTWHGIEARKEFEKRYGHDVKPKTGTSQSRPNVVPIAKTR